MKTGRLMKFRRPGVDVHAYVYREGEQVLAAVYVNGGPEGLPPPANTFRGASESEVEGRVRAWVDEHFPRKA